MKLFDEIPYLTDDWIILREMTDQGENPAVFRKTLTEGIEKFNGHLVLYGLSRDGWTLDQERQTR